MTDEQMQCPLCSRTIYVKKSKRLYEHHVCKKCYYKFANWRQLAFFLDLVSMYIFMLIVIIVFGLAIQFIGLTSEDFDMLFDMVFDGLFWGMTLSFLFKESFSGQSLGKVLCGIKVINKTSGEPCGMVASIKRNLPLFIPFMPIIVALQLSKGHRIGDRWSNTKVIWKRYSDHPIFAPTQTVP